MATITMKGSPMHTAGDLPRIGSQAPRLNLVATDLSEVSLEKYAGKKKVLNIFPSIDTSVCSTSVKKFHQAAAKYLQTVILNISADLPFAHKRFCAAEGIENAVNLSTFRSTFGKDWGVEIIDPPLKGLCSRAVVVVDENNKVLYTEQVADIGHEPNYDKALAVL